MSEVDTGHTKVGDRGECVQCRRTMVIRAAGRCATCYRYRNGRAASVAECVDCGRVRTVYTAHRRCGTCYRYWLNPEQRHKREPNDRESRFTTYMFARVGPITGLRQHERAAFAEVHRIWSRHPSLTLADQRVRDRAASGAR